jgi:hypothetical protein
MTDVTITAIVCGGRAYSDREHVYRALDILRIDRIIHGGAPGADALASAWAVTRGVPAIEVPADWAKHGPAAGPIRNAAMLAMRPHFVVAFQGGRGTEDMARRARAAGLIVVQL